MVLEFEQREATNRATAQAVYSLRPELDPRPKKEPKPKPKKEPKPPPTNVGVTAGDPRIGQDPKHPRLKKFNRD